MKFEEIYEKIKDLEVTFSSYYKYNFTYKNTDASVLIGFGGNHNDIYRLSLKHTMKVSDIGEAIRWITFESTDYYSDAW